MQVSLRKILVTGASCPRKGVKQSSDGHANILSTVAVVNTQWWCKNKLNTRVNSRLCAYKHLCRK